MTSNNGGRNYENKIIQHEPAWALHAYLRFIEQPYSCDFSPSEVALGCSTLPIVMTREIDGSGSKIKLFHEREGLEKLQASHADTSHCPYLLQLDEKASSYLQHTVIAISNQIRQFKYNKADSRLSPFGINFVQRFLFDIRVYFNRGRFDSYPDSSETSLLQKLEKCYTSLNKILDGEESTPFLYAFEAVILKEGVEPIGHLTYSIPDMTSRCTTRGISDALLFGSIAAALQDETIAPLIIKQANVMKYFDTICRSYFFSGTVCTYKHKLWQVVVQDLVERYLSSSVSDHLRQRLTANHEIPVDVSLVVMQSLDADAPFTNTTSSTSTFTTASLAYDSSVRLASNTLSYSNIYGDGDAELKSYSVEDAVPERVEDAMAKETVIRSSEEQEDFLLATVSEEAWKVNDEPSVVLAKLEEVIRFERPKDFSSFMRVAFISSVGVSFLSYFLRL